MDPLTADYLSTLGPRWISTGHTCCIYARGSAVPFYSAPHPLGPYTVERVMTAGIPAQQTNILRYIDEGGEVAFLWQGDQWQSAPDHIKGHDLTYTVVIEFDSRRLLIPIQY